MEGVWNQLVPRDKRHEVFATSLLEWIYLDLGDNRNVGNTIWSTLFAMNLWWRWKWRCINVFHGTGKYMDRVKIVKDQATELNTDDTSRGNPVIAASGGVIRNASRLWCRSFALNIGTCTSPLAELWGVYYGLLIAWESKAHRVEVEVDSEMVVGFLKTRINEVHPLSFMVRVCHGFISTLYQETGSLYFSCI
ncbi:unnamed protein product [Microthlaspi erraticum]|uniref:RNase H type-1 domain-containing protein n=1 Tax=Microthlaspi erraticum TaxID=1685480 RepID=A0A6D2JH61_9BRAS|nr:unnamed protein product [Microthlaspi erraticum]